MANLKWFFSTEPQKWKERNTDGSVAVIAANPFDREITVHFEIGGLDKTLTLPPGSLNTLVKEADV